MYVPEIVVGIFIGAAGMLVLFVALAIIFGKDDEEGKEE